MKPHIPKGTHTQIFRRRKGYSSAPHFHTINESITCLFYLPSSHDYAHLGTDLYRVVAPYRGSWNDLTKYSLIDPTCVRLERTSRYVPNNALIYFNTPWSVHGNTMQEVDFDRWFALITLNTLRSMRGLLPRLFERSRSNPFGLDIDTAPPF